MTPTLDRVDTTTLALDFAVQPSHLLVLLPAVAAVLVLLLTGRSRRGAYVIVVLAGILGLLAAAALVAQQARGGAVGSARTIGSLPMGDGFEVPLRLVVDRLDVLIACAVALVSLVVQTFARWYLFSDPRYRQFAATVALFTAAMQLVVLSGDLLLILVGWELMGWCSYLLIGHESERPKARRAAYKAFLVTRVADAPFAIGLAILALGAHTTSIAEVVRHWQTTAGEHGAALSLALICIVCAVAGKSAQFPFQDWLPDAMEGPTPASALIHAATMVAAGTVVLAKLITLLELSDAARVVLTLAAAISTVGAAALAFCQHDLKKLLAWSTVSQVGLMLLGLAVLPVGDPGDLGVAHLLSHAMFKALLFLMIGWSAVLVGGTIVERQSGALRRYPVLRRMTGIGLLALAGIPPFAGFVSKDLIVDEAAHRGVSGDLCARIAFVALLLVVALTAAYAMRMWLILIHRTGSQRQNVRVADDDSYVVEDVGIVEMLASSERVDQHGRPLEDSTVVIATEEEVGDPAPGGGARLGLQLLAILSVVGGALVFTPMLDIDWKGANVWLIGAALLLMIAVGLVVRILSVGTIYGDAASHLPVPVRSMASRGLGFDGVYVRLVARPVVALAAQVAKCENLLDRGVQALPALTTRAGEFGRKVHTRRPTSGLVAVAIGVVVVGLMGVVLW